MKRLGRFALLNVGIMVAGIAGAAVAHATAPPGRYQTGSVSGSVRDTETGLTWQQNVSTAQYTQGDAATYCTSLGTGWRLPSLKELITIVDPTQAAPSIDGSWFPNTPADLFWTSTPKLGASSSAWIVRFVYGFATGADVWSNCYVRCVR